MPPVPMLKTASVTLRSRHRGEAVQLLSPEREDQGFAPVDTGASYVAVPAIAFSDALEHDDEMAVDALLNWLTNNPGTELLLARMKVSFTLGAGIPASVARSSVASGESVFLLASRLDGTIQYGTDSHGLKNLEVCCIPSNRSKILFGWPFVKCFESLRTDDNPGPALHASTVR